jgi:hypothetical protein
VLSNIESIRLFVVNAFREPVAAAYPREPKRIVSAGTDFEVEFRVENLTGGPNLVMTSGLNVPEKKLVTVLSNETWQAQLSAYQRDSYSVTFRAQQAGELTLRPVGTAKAGWLRSEQALQSKDCKVRVLAEIDRHPRIEEFTHSESASTLRATFCHGNPQGRLSYQCDINLPLDWRVYVHEIAGAKIAIGRDTATIKCVGRLHLQERAKFPIHRFSSSFRGEGKGP